MGRAGSINTEVLTYVDPEHGFRGYLAFCGNDHRLAAGGLRVQPGLRGETVVALARAMYLKERLLGLGVDGAKAGIDLDPSSPVKHDALRRFLRFLRPHLADRLSLGPDLGTQWDELERLARDEQIPSIKMAVATAQGFDPAELTDRLRVLDEVVDGRTVGQRRAGHALGHAALAAAAACEPGHARRPLRAAVQGFGTLGRAASQSLARAGARVVAVADVDGSLVADDGLDVAALLHLPHGQRLTDNPGPGACRAPREAVLEEEVDILVLAACEDGLSCARAATADARAVVVGANLGLSVESEHILHRRGVVVIPDFVAGCGGSASMDVLFGAPTCPSGHDVLDLVGRRMEELVAEVVGLARQRGITTRRAALALCDSRSEPTDGRPYGRWAETAASRRPTALAHGR